MINLPTFGVFYTYHPPQTKTRENTKRFLQKEISISGIKPAQVIKEIIKESFNLLLELEKGENKKSRDKQRNEKTHTLAYFRACYNCDNMIW